MIVGDISVIARRLQDGHVQYGWSGNGGYYSMVGARLLKYYQDPDAIEYLFGLGQLRRLGVPYNEINHTYSDYLTNVPANSPHYLGTTENEIFSKILFIDYGYFYDLDKRWYYVVPGDRILKIPLEIIARNLDDRGDEFTFLYKIKQNLMAYIFGGFVNSNATFRQYMAEKGEEPDAVYAGIPSEEESMYSPSMIYDYERKYENVLEWFDPWVVVDEEPENETLKFKVRPAGETHTETILW